MPNVDEKRWERLAAQGVKREMPTPEGEAKMSVVIFQLAEPMLSRVAQERAKPRKRK